jgi:hypothetical protein
MTALRSSWPVLAVLAALVAVGYPLALAFGLPLARRDMQDVRKWLRETVRAEAPLDLTPMLERAGTITPDEVVTSTDTVPSALLAVLGGRSSPSCRPPTPRPASRCGRWRRRPAAPWCSSASPGSGSRTACWPRRRPCSRR